MTNARPYRQVSQNDLFKAYTYDPSSGRFMRNEEKKSWKSKAGFPEGVHKTKKKIYRTLRIGRRAYLAHRMAWLYVHGEMPDGMIDHIDGDGTNNAIANLRVVGIFENNINTPIRSKNRSGHKHVIASHNHWIVKMRAFGRMYYIGRFSDYEIACEVAVSASQFMHGEFSTYHMPTGA